MTVIADTIRQTLITYLMGTYRPVWGRLAVALSLGRAYLRRFRLLGPFAQGIPCDPSGHEPERNEDEVAD